MSTDGARRAMVVGGSLGGLFAATTLRAIGWDVQVFERSPSVLDSRGGGIVLQPDVLAAFRFAGIRHTKALGVESGDRIYLDERDNVVQRTFMPQTQTSWNMLHGALSRALPSEFIHRGETLVKFEQGDDAIEAHFASGRIENGNVLIGADGPRSTLRKLVLPDLEPSYSGYVAWRGLVPEAEVSERARQKLDGTFPFQQGSDFMMLAYLVPGEDESIAVGRRRWNWVWYRKIAAGNRFRDLMTDAAGRRREFSLPPGALSVDARDRLLVAARQLLAPSFHDLVSATTEPFVQAILDLQVPRMVFGRALLLGDAAFIPRPHTAGSTAKAAANAVSLAETLLTSATVESGLKEWESWQRRAGIEMSKWGIAMGDRIMSIGKKA